MSLHHSWGWQTPQTASNIHITHIQSVWEHWYAVQQHTASALPRYPHYWWLRFWGYELLAKSKWCHYVMIDADSTFQFHIRHIQSVWAHWYAVQRHTHTVEALSSYFHTTCLRFWGSGLLVESKWCHYVMVDTNSHLKLKLFPASTLEIYTVFDHIDMVSIGTR